MRERTRAFVAHASITDLDMLSDGFLHSEDLSVLKHAMPLDSQQQDRLTRWIEANDANCPSCGYSLRGIRDPNCPECGFGFDLESLIQEHVGRRRWGAGLFWPLISIAIVVGEVGSTLVGGVGLIFVGRHRRMWGHGNWYDLGLTVLWALIVFGLPVVCAILSARHGRSWFDVFLDSCWIKMFAVAIAVIEIGWFLSRAI